MTSIAKLKDQARKHEQKEDWSAAIEAYRSVLEQEQGDDQLDVELSLFNRLGDLHLRIGQPEEAVSYYETAADRYADAGFYNNAIALCNKALRHQPNRPELYRKLSGLCAEQGFHTDARRWILEYAERRMRAGEVDDALSALADFADMSDDPEVRETLGQHLAAQEHPDDAIHQLRLAYQRRMERGEQEAAGAVADTAAAIDPTVDLRSEPLPEPAKPETAFEEQYPAPPQVEPASEEELAGLETRPEGLVGGEEEVTGLEGLETTAAGVEEDEERGGLSGLETSPDQPATVEPEPEEAAEEPVEEEEPVGAGGLGDLETFEPPAAPTEEEPGAAEEEPEEEAEPLPLLDEDEEASEEEAAEPLPLLDGTEVPGEVAAPEAPAEEEPAEPVSAEEEPAEPVSAEEEPAEPVSAEEEAELEGVESAPAEVGAEDELMMEFDIGELDLGAGEVKAPPPPDREERPSKIDSEAVLQQSRDLVSRALYNESLRQLRLLPEEADKPVYEQALMIVNEVLRHDSENIDALQRRVEYALRLEDRQLLIESYLEVAEALERAGAETKARAIYERVLDLDPSHEAAREAVGAAPVEEDSTIDLDAVLREMEPEELEAAESESGAGDPNFSAMLSQFRAKVSEPVSVDEAGDHYDLGLAFKEMGLIDEAITEFQTALAGGTERLKVYEELGQCHLQQGQCNVAIKVLKQALQVAGADEAELVGVYYHLGKCYEELGQREDARDAYGRVLAIDDSFADVPDRIARL